jgi:hypothetical protein
VSKAFSRSTNINKPGISELILTHSPIYFPLRKPFCVWLIFF